MQDGHEVQVIASPNLHQFIGFATLEGLSGKPVLAQNFEPGRMMDHIHLARWCDMAILYPASANQINKLAAGIAEDLIGTLFLAYELKKKPYLLAPAMNVEMFQHPVTKQSLKALAEFGVSILNSPAGSLACGEYGAGRLLEPEGLLVEIGKYLGSTSKTGKKILLTSGGTRESIDGVRFIANLSSGKTGQILAAELSKAGHKVTHLHPGENAERENRFTDFRDLDQKIQARLSQEKYDWIIHMAAVSDFSVKAARIRGEAQKGNSKLDSSQNVSLELTPNYKIISRLVKYSKNKNVQIIGFKLTDTRDKKLQSKAIQKILDYPGIRYVVHNDVREIHHEDEKHKFTVLGRKNAAIQCSSKTELSETLLKIIK